MATEKERAGYIPGWTFADKFRKARTIAGMGQREFADSLELSPSTVAAYERGRAEPRFRDVVALAKRIQLLTGIEYQWFLDIDDDFAGPSGIGSARAVGRTGLEPVTGGLWVAPVTPLFAA